MANPPKFDPLRRNARVGPVELPAGGYQGEIPTWPLPGRQSAAEREAWAQLWRTPQAAAWAELGWTRTVARYCRTMVRAERTGSTAAIQGAAHTLENDLGLTPRAMRLLLWTVGRPAGAPEEVASPADELDAARKRLRPTAGDA
jgi:hypothetical protein